MTSMRDEMMASGSGHENTGEPRATETGMRGSVGGRGKRAAQTVPRLRPTRLLFRFHCYVSSKMNNLDTPPRH